MIYLANLVFRLGQLPGTRKGSEWPEYKTASTNWYVCAVYSMCTYIHVHVYIHNSVISCVGKNEKEKKTCN